MTGHRSQLINFVSTFIGTVRFRNDQVAAIMGYGDYHIGNVTILRVYYVKGLGHNLFLVGQFSDSNLEVAFRKHTCFVHDLEDVDLLTGSMGTNLYTLSLEDTMKSSLIYLLSKSSKTKSWLWHRRLSHINFSTINELAKQGLVRCLPKLKYAIDHLCSVCSLGKSKKHTHKPKSEDSIQEKLYLLNIDLCGLMRIKSISGKKYILVIVDDYSWFTWVKFLRSKDETPELIIKYLKQAEAVATACYTQNRSLIRKRHNKIPYELLHDRKPDLKYSPAKKAYQIYNRRTRLIMEIIHIKLDEQTTMASEQFSSGLELQLMTPRTPSPSVVSRVLPAVAPIPANTIGTPSSTNINQDAPSHSTSPTSHETQSLVIHLGVEE
ncbi:retrovirus-related pol polyprotein from transposon TNT 1-94 [Tanacetum coccineum]|uniref:Retrovirus-related pol polyprotein from transposon TNT 1-94 n=1 Tax=Tanacetum coccineum TaxID=301880 RepID=A0ABQ5FK51_9ASTR